MQKNHKKRYNSHFLLIFALILVPFSAFSAEKATNNDLKSLENAIKTGKVKEQALKKNAAQIAAERTELNSQIKVAAKQIQTSEAHLSSGEKKLQILTLDAKKLEVKYNKHKNTLAKLIAALLRLQKNPPPALLTNPEDASNALRSAIILGKVVPEVKNQSDIIAHDLANLTAIQQELNGQQNELISNTQQLRKQRNYIAQLLKQKQSLSSKTQVEIKQEQQKMAILGKKAKNIRDLFDKIEQQKKQNQINAVKAATKAEQQRLQAIEDKKIQLAVAQKSQNKQQVEQIQTSITNLKRPPSRTKHVLTPFGQLKGKLPFPAQGRFLLKFGQKDRQGTSAKGIDISTRPFAQITSPATGTVIYAQRFRNAGFLVIINVGKEYNILLTGLGKIVVEPNQFIESGDPIGIMPKTAVNGENSSNTNPILFVEFRKNGKSINPSPWWNTKLSAN